MTEAHRELLLELVEAAEAYVETSTTKPSSPTLKYPTRPSRKETVSMSC